ncbi:hypothetical protein EV361DRAFT_398012 [Lentinula raphanica]|nr:hypothetical protein EV361DRAFT_398012 [Lentinula raphanica]
MRIWICAGAVRRLGGHYFEMLNPMAYERLHGRRYPETLAYLGALEDGQNESSVTSRTLFVEYPPIYFRHNQPPTYILTHDEGAEPTTILPTSEQERLNDLVRQNLERQKDYEHVDIRFLDRFVATARFVDITVIYLRVIDSAKFYEARRITVVLNGSVMKPGKIQMLLGTGDEHYPDAHAL